MSEITEKIINKIVDIMRNERACCDEEVLEEILTSVKTKVKFLWPFSIRYTRGFMVDSYEDCSGRELYLDTTYLPKRFETVGAAYNHMKKIEAREDKMYKRKSFKILYHDIPIQVTHFFWGETIWNKDSWGEGISIIEKGKIPECYIRNVPTFLHILKTLYNVTPELYNEQTGRDLKKDVSTELFGGRPEFDKLDPEAKQIGAW